MISDAFLLFKINNNLNKFVDYSKKKSLLGMHQIVIMELIIFWNLLKTVMLFI